VGIHTLDELMIILTFTRQRFSVNLTEIIVQYYAEYP